MNGASSVSLCICLYRPYRRLPSPTQPKAQAEQVRCTQQAGCWVATASIDFLPSHSSDSLFCFSLSSRRSTVQSSWKVPATRMKASLHRSLMRGHSSGECHYG
jgi:hypothetical protein